MKYIWTIKIVRKKESNILKGMQEQQQIIWHQVCPYTEALDKQIMIDNSNNEAAFKLNIHNLNIMHSFPTILRPFFTLGIIRNQANFLSTSLNNANAGKISDKKNSIAIAGRTNGRKNTIPVESDISNKEAKKLKKNINFVVANEEAGESNNNTKVDLKIQLEENAKVGSKI